MKNIKYLVLLGILMHSCSGGGDDGTPAKNQKPLKVSVLSYPTDNLLCITNVLDFKWEASIDPDGDTVSYVLDISEDNQFSEIEQSFKVSGTNKEVTLEKDMAYYWRVKAVDSKNSSSDYSSVHQFYTEGLGVLNHLPFSPDLVSPQLNEVITGATVNLRWTASDVDNDPLTYDVFLGTINPPMTKVEDNQSEANLSVELNTATTYYWKVEVTDGKGGRAIGQVWNFTTK